METFTAFLLYLPLALLFGVALLEFAGAWQHSNRHDASSALLLWSTVILLLPALFLAWMVKPAAANGIPNPYASPALTGILVLLLLSALGMKAYCRANGITPKPSKHRRNARLKGKALRQQMIPGAFRGLLALTCVAAGASMFMISSSFDTGSGQVAEKDSTNEQPDVPAIEEKAQVAKIPAEPEEEKTGTFMPAPAPVVTAAEPAEEASRVEMTPVEPPVVTKIEPADSKPAEPLVAAADPPAGDGTMEDPIQGSPFSDMPEPMGEDNTGMMADTGDLPMQDDGTMEPVSNPEPSPEPEPEPAMVASNNPTPTPPAASDSGIYKKIVAPLFNDRCNDCHGAEKQKGGLRLDTPEWIRKGGDSGPVLIAGNPDKSYIYEVVVLPEDDPDIMPPKGKPLSDSQQRYIKQWILEGAPLGDGKQWPGGGGSVVAGGGSFAEDKMADGVASPNAALIQKLNDEGIIVRPLSSNGAMLEVDYSHASRAAGDLRLQELVPLSENIHTIDLKKTKVVDEDLKVLERMTNIRKINLALTDIGDSGLVSIRDLENIEYLNLYGTRVSDSSVSDLSKMKTLTKLFLWNSRVTDSGYSKLKRALPKTDISFGL